MVIWGILSIQIARDAKMRRVTDNKACPGEGANGVAGQPSPATSEGSKGQTIPSDRDVLEKIRPMTHGSPSPSK